MTYSSYDFFIPENVFGILNVGHFSPPLSVDIFRRCDAKTSDVVVCDVQNDAAKGRTYYVNKLERVKKLKRYFNLTKTDPLPFDFLIGEDS